MTGLNKILMAFNGNSLTLWANSHQNVVRERPILCVFLAPCMKWTAFVFCYGCQWNINNTPNADYMARQYHEIWCGAFLKSSECTTFSALWCDLQPIRIKGLQNHSAWECTGTWTAFLCDSFVSRPSMMARKNVLTNGFSKFQYECPIDSLTVYGPL